MMTPDKVQDPDSLLAWRRTVAGDEGIAVVTGTFDLFQPGNLQAVRRARSLARYVIVVVEPDEVVAGHAGDGRPQNHLEPRVEMVTYLRDVHAVTCLGRGDGRDFFRSLRPFIWVATDGDASPREPYAEALSALARVEKVAPLKGCSTGEIILAMREHHTPLKLPAGWDQLLSGSAVAVAESGVPVSVNGCFDILHVGHLRFLAEARGMGGSLTVFINDDRSVARYKGPTRPVFPEAFRAAALGALWPVDRVIAFAGDNPMEELRRWRPLIHVKGGTYEPERVRQERELVESWGGRLVCTPMVDGFSTTHFIARALAGGKSRHGELPETLQGGGRHGELRQSDQLQHNPARDPARGKDGAGAGR
jgi:rfaE bifunctional protein nucleotidyltransferase chain/domain